MGCHDNRIHPTAIVGDEVRMGQGNEIGPYAVIEGPVTLGDRNIIAAGVWIGGPVSIGSGNYFAPKATIGAPAEWSTDDGETIRQRHPCGVQIGDRNVVRELVTIHQGSERPTVVGSSCYIMNHAHLGHDAELADRVNITASATLAGFVTLGYGSYLGLGANVLQRTVIGALAIVGMGAVVNRHVPPATVAIGTPARVTGINHRGFERHGIEVGPVDDPALRDALARLNEGVFDEAAIPVPLHPYARAYLADVAAAHG